MTGIDFKVEEPNSCVTWCQEQLVFAVLVNPATTNTEGTMKDVEAAARGSGGESMYLNATTNREMTQLSQRLHAMGSKHFFVGGSDPFFTSRRVRLQLGGTTSGSNDIRFSAIEDPEVGGLMSYGSNIADAWRQVGAYTGRILKGDKPTDLPVRTGKRVRDRNLTSRPHGCSASTCHPRCSLAPTG